LKLKSQKAFTIIELIMVIVILGILAAVAIPKFADLSTSAKAAATQGGLGAIRSVIAIEYAKSATTGGTVAFPASITTTLFADNRLPTNKLNDSTGVANVTVVPGGTATSASGWWYISTLGQAGAYSDGTSDTSVY